MDWCGDLVIDGSTRPSASGDRLAVVDPSTGDRLGDVADGGPADIQAAIESARAAQPGWAATAPRERGVVLSELARLLRRDVDVLADMESRDTGKPMAQARADVEVAAQYFEFYAGYADKLYGDTIPLGDGRLAFTVREARGVTGHVIPWNYPLQIGGRTLAPSLMAGNAAVLKPAEEAPFSAIALGLLAHEAGLPRGVLNVVPGRGEQAGAALAGSDAIDHLSFTGGLETGRLVMGAAATNVKPVTLELGGKSPSILLADADIERAVPVLVKALIQNCGQTCSAGTRVIIDRSIHGDVVDAIAAHLSKVTIGRGIDDPDVGPLISEAQRQRVLGYVGVGVDEGARVVAGGGAAAVEGAPGGYYVTPTLFDRVEPDMRVAREEIFGPVLSALACDGEADALAIANGTDFGLVASVWTGDVDRALWLAQRVVAGQVYVNSYGAAGGVALPFGGMRHSGFGREKGVEAVHEYTHTKTVVIDIAAPAAS